MLFLFLLILANPIQSAHFQPPINGDWIITDIALVENTTLIMNGSILIQSGGALILRNSSLYMNLESDGQHRIEVYEGGNLTIINSLITAFDPNNNYNIEVDNGSKFLLDNSEISYAGYSFPETGLWIRTQNATIRNSKIHHNSMGIHLDSSRNTTIDNNTITDNEDGIRMTDSGDIKIINNTIADNTIPYVFEGFGINSWNCSEVTIDNNTIIGNGHGIFIGSGNFTIIENIIENGVSVSQCSDFSLSNNTVSSSLFWGMLGRGYVAYSVNGTIHNNAFVNCGLTFYGNYTTDYFDHDVSGNTANGKAIHYLFNKTGAVIDDGGQVILAFSKDVLLKDLNLSITTLGSQVLFSSNVTLNNITLTNNGQGIQIVNSSSVTISDNNMTNNPDYGIYIQNCTDSTIKDNNMAYSGIEIQDCVNITLDNNTLIGCGLSFVNPYEQNTSFYDHIIVDNTVNGKPLCYVFNQTGIVIEDAGQAIITFSEDIIVQNSNLSYTSGGAIILYSSDVTINNNNITNTVDGICLVSTRNVTLRENLVSNCSWGIQYSWDCNDSVVDNNIVVNSTWGITLLNCRNFVLNDNIVTYSVFLGVEITNCLNVSLNNNTVESNANEGIMLETCWNITLYNNTIANNSGDGISISGGGLYMGYISYIVISNNTVADNNGTGISMIWNRNSVVKYNIIRNSSYGIYLETCSNVTVFLNDFIVNSHQAYDGGSNNFDNSTVGNYWSDYIGTDSNGDGIGDFPYNIDGDSIDRYPLMRPIFAAELNPPDILEVKRNPIDPTNLDTVTIHVSAIDDTSVSQVKLGFYEQTTWTNVTMPYNSTSGYYEAQIPVYPVGWEIEYKVYAKDAYSNWAVSQSYNYIVSPETMPPEIIRIDQIPTLPDDRHPVYVGVVAIDESGISEVILSFYNGTMWNNETMTMNNISGFYEAQVPILQSGTEVEYKIYVCDESGNWIASQSYFYTVVSGGEGIGDLTLILLAGSGAAIGVTALTIAILMRKRGR